MRQHISKQLQAAEHITKHSDSPLTVEDIKRIDKEVKKFLANLKLDGSSKKASLSGAFSELKSKRF